MFNNRYFLIVCLVTGIFWGLLTSCICVTVYNYNNIVSQDKRIQIIDINSSDQLLFMGEKFNYAYRYLKIADKHLHKGIAQLHRFFKN